MRLRPAEASPSRARSQAHEQDHEGHVVLGGSDPLSVEISTHGSETTLALIGVLDLLSTHVLDVALAPLWAQSTAITVDLSRLTFIDSSGLWAISRMARWCVRKPIALRLIPGSDSVQGVFTVTGLESVLPFVPLQAAHGR